MHDLTIKTLRELQQKMVGSSAYERILLLAIATHPGESMAGYGRRIGITPGAMTTIVDRLAGVGLVDRTAAKLDRRTTRLKVTKKGLRIIAAAEERARKEVA